MSVHPDFKELESFVCRLPERFHKEGTCIYKGRNELRIFEEKGYQLVVKSYKRPNLFNRIAYGFLRSSKAERAYRYGLLLVEKGFGTPTPVGFVTCRQGLFFENSYSISLQSACPYTFRDFGKRDFERWKEILEAIAILTARLHDSGILHKDYSAGNILFDDSQEIIPVEIVDLNRMRFGHVSREEGCRNFERIRLTDCMFDVLGYAYAKERGFDPDTCIKEIKAARKREAIRTNEEL